MTEITELLKNKHKGIPASWSEIQNTRRTDGSIFPTPEFLCGGTRIIQEYIDKETGRKYRALFILETESQIGGFQTPTDIEEIK